MDPSDAAADPSDPTAAATAAAASASVEPPLQQAAAPDDGNLTLVLSLVLPLLIAAYFLLFRKGRKGGTGKSVVLFGPMGAGKTSTHLHLRFGRHIPSHTSMQLTTATFVPKVGPPGGALTVVDAPGESRLAYHLRAELPSAAVLVCVIDATALPTQAAQAAQVLYDVLTDDSVQRRSPPLIVAANHSDQRGAAAPAAVRKTLETELQRVRLARTTMQDTSGRSTLKGGLADPSAPPFSFDQLAGPAVEVVATAAGAQPKLEPLLAAIRKHA